MTRPLTGRRVPGRLRRLLTPIGQAALYIAACALLALYFVLRSPL